MDDMAHMMVGGEHGEAIIPGNPGMSSFCTRTVLPVDDENFMQTKGSPPLSVDFSKDSEVNSEALHTLIPLAYHLTALKNLFNSKLTE